MRGTERALGRILRNLDGEEGGGGEEKEEKRDEEDDARASSRFRQRDIRRAISIIIPIAPIVITFVTRARAISLDRQMPVGGRVRARLRVTTSSCLFPDGTRIRMTEKKTMAILPK